MDTDEMNGIMKAVTDYDHMEILHEVMRPLAEEMERKTDKQTPFKSQNTRK